MCQHCAIRSICGRAQSGLGRAEGELEVSVDEPINIALILNGIAQFFDYLPFSSDAVNAVVFLTIPSVVGVVVSERLGVQRRQRVLRSE